MRRPIHRTAAGLCLAATLWAAAAGAQVRPQVDGNTLPEDHPSPAAIQGLAPHDEHNGHDHAAHALAASTPQQHAAFAEALDLSAFSRLAVFDAGRVKIVDTLAREQLERIYGKSRWKDPTTGVRYDPVFTYLDLVLNRSYYFGKPLIYVEVLPLRRRLVSHLPADQQDAWLKIGRLAPAMFADPRVQSVFAAMDGDLRLIKGRQQVVSSAVAFDETGSRLALVSPMPGHEYWRHVGELADTRTAAAVGPVGLPVPIAQNAEAARHVANLWAQLGEAWRAGEAESVNAVLGVLAKEIPRLNPESYPPAYRLAVERIYNATHRFTLGYIGYLLGAVVLLVALGMGRAWLVRLGLGLLGLGVVVHTLGIAARVLLSGRWPIHNQYESFIAVTWFAVIVGVAMMWWKRQWLFGAAASALGACSLLFANTVDIPSSGVGQVAAILGTSRILYVHVNMVLVSYGLIGLGFFVSLFYLVAHYTRSREALSLAAAGVGPWPAAAPVGGATGPSDAPVDSGGDPRDDRSLPRRAALLRDLDRAQLVVLQLAFWILGVGILLGAYWADHAWGRWWAWDPKETWALITWIVYLIAIHARFGAKDRGLTTAWLSVLGFFVMLWCYWGVNLLLAGLHSYA